MLFNTTEASEEMPSFEILEPGEYFAEICGADHKPNKKMNGEYIRLDFKVKRKGKDDHKLTSFFNIKHSESPRAQQIGQAQFKQLLNAIGVSRVLKDIDELKTFTLWKTLFVAVDVGEYQGKPQNVITAYINKKDRPEPTDAVEEADLEIPF